MRDFCAELRLVLCTMLQEAGIDAAPARLRLCCGDCDAAYALREGRAFDPAAFPSLHPWIAAAAARENRILFFLSERFYRDAAAHILCEALLPLPPSIEDGAGYALARMRMLARKGGDFLDDTIKKAFFLCLYANESGISGSARSARRREAAQAALSIGKDRPLAQRQAYLASCGMAAGCMARLLQENMS